MTLDTRSDQLELDHTRSDQVSRGYGSTLNHPVYVHTYLHTYLPKVHTPYSTSPDIPPYMAYSLTYSTTDQQRRTVAKDGEEEIN